LAGPTKSPQLRHTLLITTRIAEKKLIIDAGSECRKEAPMNRILQSLQKLVMFVSVLVCRCANASSRSEKGPLPVRAHQAIARCIPREGLTSFAAYLVLATLTTGCASVQHIAIDRVGDAMATQGDAFASDDDPELVGSAIPFSLKLIESLLAQRPEHAGLLLAATSDFTQYAYGWVDQHADEIADADPERAAEQKERARHMYLRASDYGMRGLEAAHPGFEAALRTDVHAAVATLTRRDVPIVYWMVAAEGLAISRSKDQPEIVARLPRMEALIDRALELNESYSDGAIHSFLIAYEMNRPGGTGDPALRSRKHFERVVELTGGSLSSPYVTYAESVCVPTQDRDQFEALLKRAIAIDPDAEQKWRLENRISQRRARWLLSHADDLFLAPLKGEAQ
jgi:predicted anti-sigma-YlaC factor YlaD